MGLSRTHPLHLILGLSVWAVWFVVLYGGLSVACKLAPPAPAAGALSWINMLLLPLTLVVVALLAWAARWCWQGHADSDSLKRFMARSAACLYLLSALATLAVALPTLFLPPCI